MCLSYSISCVSDQLVMIFAWLLSSIVEKSHSSIRWHLSPQIRWISKKRRRKHGNTTCVRSLCSICLCAHKRTIFFRLDGEYNKGITFYKLAIDKLRRYCQTVSNAAEKKRGSDVRTQQSMLVLSSVSCRSSLVSSRTGTWTAINDRTWTNDQRSARESLRKICGRWWWTSDERWSVRWWHWWRSVLQRSDRWTTDTRSWLE